MIISTYTERASDKIQQYFMLKALNQLEIEDNFLSLIKGIC